MEHNGFSYSNMSTIQAGLAHVPAESGIYAWVYWPDFEPETITPSELLILLKEYTSIDLQYPEDLSGTYKFQATIRERRFKDVNSESILGLSIMKQGKLLSFLDESAENRLLFYTIFKEICFARPFYIGKAKNLKTRLVKNHLAGKTPILPKLIEQEVPGTQVWIGYKLIPAATIDEVNNIFEEVMSRVLKPGLTKKPN